MAFEGEFSKILRQKMDFPLENDNSQVIPKARFPLNMGQFIQIFRKPVKWTPPQIPKAYPRQPKKIKIQPAPKKVQRVVEKSWALSELPDPLVIKITNMEALGARWSDSISQSNVKAEFRRLAKIYHPDHQHTHCDGKKFQILLLLYRQIRSHLELIAQSKEQA